MRRIRSRPLATETGQLSKEARKIIDAARTAASSFSNKMFADMYVWAIEQKVLHNNPDFLRFLKNLREPPVSIETFLDSPDFLGATDMECWPEVRTAIIALNKYWWKGKEHSYTEFLGMQASGNGKTFIATITTLYHLHLLGCMKNPQSYYRLSKNTSIVGVIQAAKPHVTKKVIYIPMRKFVEEMPWFQRNMRPNKLLEAEMYFEEQNVRIVQGGSDSDTVLGEAVILAILDEVNFMAIVEQSKKAGAGTGRTASYDVAANIHGAITRRKRRSFPSHGPNIGIICTISQNKYKGDFTDRLYQQTIAHGHRHVYTYAKAQYEAQPADRHSSEKFRLFIGDDAAGDIRVLADDEIVHGGRVEEVPADYRPDFDRDPVNATREVIGISLGSVNPFFRQRSKIMFCVQKGEDAGLASFLHKDNVVLEYEGLPMPIKGHFCKNPSKPRYVHIDLSNTGDRCGVCMLRFDGIEYTGRSDGESDAMPVVTMELSVTFEPDHGNEIDIAEVRAWVRMLKTKYGYPIQAVSYDGWNSLESRQAWKRQGMKTGAISVDRTSTPYKQLREALYDGRINMYHQEVLLDELFNLEYDEKKDKVDHPIKGSKDCADALCGAYQALLTRASSWNMPHGDTEGRADFSDREDYERV